MLKRGIYEQVRNREISKEIDDNNDIITKLEKIDQAESSTILAKYITEIIEKGLNQIHDTEILFLKRKGRFCIYCLIKRANNCE